MTYQVEIGPFGAWYVRTYERGMDILISALFSGAEAEARARDYAAWMNRRAARIEHSECD